MLVRALVPEERFFCIGQGVDPKDCSLDKRLPDFPVHRERSHHWVHDNPSIADAHRYD